MRNLRHWLGGSLLGMLVLASAGHGATLPKPPGLELSVCKENSGAFALHLTSDDEVHTPAVAVTQTWKKIDHKAYNEGAWHYDVDGRFQLVDNQIVSVSAWLEDSAHQIIAKFKVAPGVEKINAQTSLIPLSVEVRAK